MCAELSSGSNPLYPTVFTFHKRLSVSGIVPGISHPVSNFKIFVTLLYIYIKHILTQFRMEKVSIKELPKVKLCGGTNIFQT